jgi:uncharacterized RDD family membrane protein YckC
MNPTHVLGRRVVAFIIDYLLLGALFAGLFFIFATHTDQTVHLTGTNLNVNFDKDTYYLQGGDATSFFAIELLIGLLYGGVIQGFTGATIGKLICGIRVMREDGQRPGLWRGVVRWVLLIVDDFPYFIPMLTGFIVALSNDRRRRVGDMAASTYVVRTSAAGQPLPALPGPVAVPGAVHPPVASLEPDQTTPSSATPAAPAAPAAFTSPRSATPAPQDQPTPAEPSSAETAHITPVPTPPSEPEPARSETPPKAPPPQPRAPAPRPAVPPPSPPPPPSLPPANWYPDPSGQARLRYWDGSRWTDHTAQ